MALLTPWGATITDDEYTLIWADDETPVQLVAIFYPGLADIVANGDPAMVDPFLRPFFNNLPTDLPAETVVLIVDLASCAVV